MKITTTILIFIIGAFGFIWYSLIDSKEDIDVYREYTETLKEFDTGDGILRYADNGKGKVILLVHGVPTNSWMYKNISDILVENGYRVIVPDLMGFGASDHLDSYSAYNFENQAQILVDLMRSLGINQWEQVVHDMGGLVTWHMVDMVPKKITHLYLLNTIIYEDTFNPPVLFNRNNKLHRWFLNLHRHKYIGKFIVNTVINHVIGQESFVPKDRKVGYWLPIRKGAEALVHFYTETEAIKAVIQQHRQILIDSGVPVSVLWGEKDTILDVGSALRLQGDLGLDKSNVIILEKAGHLVPEESSEEIASYIINRYE